MLAQRVATAVVGIPVILALILLGGVPFSLAVAAVLAVAALEFFAATDPQRPQGRTGLAAFRQRLLALLAAGAVVLLVAGAHNGADWFNGALVLSVAALFLALVIEGDVASGLRQWLWLAGGVLYVGFLGAHLVLLRHLDEGRDWVIIAVFATFATDTAAYFAGRSFGRTHIAPHISPGKTLEGSLGGLGGGFAAVLLLNWITGFPAGPGEGLLLALLLPAAAEIGDLAESLLKRGAGVKDTGVLVPGHGGLLDRLDSVLFTTPLVYYFVIWVVP
ncbi:MAG TPA: phosphatidate cytidylyltransferase [Dehalococcoidia bacterium]|nr:phosphatidate cytidylyltransferase [Dehalococcoidia bacterium]